MSPNRTGAEVIINTGCCHDCGGRCVLRAQVKNGRIVRIETDSTTDEPLLRACLRGRAYRQRVYHPDRLQYPLRRVGGRGEGKFQRISWEEALDTVAAELRRIRDSYGAASILLVGGSGNQGLLHGPDQVARLLSAFGGYTRPWGSASFEGALFASMATYGTIWTGNTFDDLVNSRLIILWGWNPANTIWDSGTARHLARAREKGIKLVAIDPRYTDTAATFCQEWIPVRPGTDVALIMGMAYTIISENRQDQAFLDKYTIGFDQFRDYVTGNEDRVAKTPHWAEPITGVPAETIARLAREYAGSKPAAIVGGWGPARAALGEQFSRAANILCVMTGNVGIHGGSALGFMRAYGGRETRGPRGPRNPVEEGAPARKDSLYKLQGGSNPTSARIHTSKLYDAILTGKAGGYSADIKMAYVVAANWLNQHPNTNKGVQALRALEFIVVHDQFMTPTAKFADILLPVNTFMERSDIAPPWLGSPYYIFLNKAVDSLYESRSDLDICLDLAKRLGVSEAFGEDSEEKRLETIAGFRPDIPDYQKSRWDGYIKVKLPEPVVSFTEQIADPEKHPFPTLSGKIEIYCQHLAEMSNPLIPPIPKYLETWESFNDPLSRKYPLQLITTHPKTRTHSTLAMVPWLREVEPHAVWINPADAVPRGISNGDPVLVFNERGKVYLPAYVTERIMPGVVNICEGMWFDPDKDGIDRGGCANVLTNDEMSPGGAVPVNTALVEVSQG